MDIELLANELKKYVWEHRYTLRVDHPFYEVIFPFCKVVFYEYEMYRSIECSITIGEKRKYDLSEILRINGYDLSGLYHNHSSVDKSLYIEQFVRELNTKLQPVLNADFTALRKLDKEYANTRKIQDKMRTAFVFDTGIYKKLIAGDPTWEDDLRAFELPKKVKPTLLRRILKKLRLS